MPLLRTVLFKYDSLYLCLRLHNARHNSQPKEWAIQVWRCSIWRSIMQKKINSRREKDSKYLQYIIAGSNRVRERAEERHICVKKEKIISSPIKSQHVTTVGVEHSNNRLSPKSLAALNSNLSTVLNKEKKVSTKAEKITRRWKRYSRHIWQL